MRTHRTAILTALLLTLIMGLQPLTGPVNAEASTMPAGANNNRQPSYENNTMMLYGKDGGNPCWGHFNNTDDGSARNGYAEEKKSSGRLDIDISCRMDPILGVNFELEIDANIVVHLFIDIRGKTGTQCQPACENLNLTLERGGKPVDAKEFDTVDDSTTEVHWAFPVTEEHSLWNKTSDNPMLKIELELETDSGLGCGFIFNCDAEFRLYYTHPKEDREDPDEGGNSTITLPILNNTVVDPDTIPPEREEEMMPGFSLLLGVAAVGLAVVVAARPPRRD
jgi:hypothetical protein